MEEFLYHVDTQNNVLGKIERKKAHKDKILHRAGVVLVFNTKGEICLTKRSPEKGIFGNCFDTACSFHVSYGETFDEAAKRELFEETKLKTELVSLGTFLLDEDPDHMIVATYTTIANDEIILDPTEATNGKYYSIEDADKIINNEKITAWLRDAWKIYKNKQLEN
jgi:isopentenyldiphosphate isomerase